MTFLTRKFLALSVLLMVFAIVGCDVHSASDQDRRAQDEKTRDETAKAVEKAKPALQEAGRELKEAAKDAAEEAHAAVEGAKEGWDRGKNSTVDVNSATRSDLTSLPGITPRKADSIIAHRPYREPHDLVSKGVLSESTYDHIRDDVIAK